eukprot:scaffold3385_cov119-Isochrysis_galbana.AAC.3
MEVSIAALPREERANQQSRIIFQVLTLASKNLSPSQCVRLRKLVPFPIGVGIRPLVACSAFLWNQPGAAMVCIQYLGIEKIIKFASKALPIIDRNLSCFQLAIRRLIFRYRVLIGSPRRQKQKESFFNQWAIGCLALACLDPCRRAGRARHLASSSTKTKSPFLPTRTARRRANLPVFNKKILDRTRGYSLCSSSSSGDSAGAIFLQSSHLQSKTQLRGVHNGRTRPGEEGGDRRPTLTSSDLPFLW